MNLKSNKLYLERCKSYFKDNYNEFIKKLELEPTKSLFLNKLKGDVIKDIDFNISSSDINPNAYYYTKDRISATKAYELGLIYPQGIESSLSSYLFNGEDINVIVDMCSAPGGKSINFINKYIDALLISNDVNYKRQLLTCSNFERLGIDKAIITSLDTKELSRSLNGKADLVILDAPCSGEGMARKTDEIYDAYSENEIRKLAEIQSNLLDEAYDMLNGNSYLVYSTCAFSFEEDELQVKSFLNRHKDMSLVDINAKDNQSTLPGTIKLSFVNNTEGQFIAILKKSGIKNKIGFSSYKTVKNDIVDRFIKDNLNVNNYYLYRNDNSFYMSFEPFINLGVNFIRQGIYLGDLVKDRFEPNHFMYRSNALINSYKYVYLLNDKQYEEFVKGSEIKVDGLANAYYSLFYKCYPVGFGKYSNGVIKNKYPKGLRRK